MRSKKRRPNAGDMESGRRITVPPPLEPSQLFQLALEEYKIIQSKIDNIGEFSQKVRGWSLTITAGIVAAAATKELPAWFALAAIVTTIFFKLGDDYQKRLQSVLIKRALRIERQFQEIIPSWAYSGYDGLPYLANTIRDESLEESRSKYVWWPFRRGWKGTKMRLWHNKRRLVWRSEYYFYWAQCGFAVLASLVLWKGKPSPTSYQADVAGVLRGVTNTPLWRGAAQTNILIIQSSPPLTNSFVISSSPSNGVATVVFPTTIANVIFSGTPPGTNYGVVWLPGPVTNFIVLTNTLNWPTGLTRTNK